MSTDSHKRTGSRGEASNVVDTVISLNGHNRRASDAPSVQYNHRQLPSHKSSATIYISSVLAASSAGSAESSPHGSRSRDTIHKAAERGNTDAVLAFIRKKRSSANLRNELGHVPLHIAALHNCYDVVDILLRNEADVNIQDNFGWSALHFAASGKNEKLLQLLLECTRLDGTFPPLILLLYDIYNALEARLLSAVSKRLR
jgi:hypothetical protein